MVFSTQASAWTQYWWIKHHSNIILLSELFDRFSIVTWNTESLSGTKSLDTGLEAKPDFVITKVLDQTDDWLTFHKGISSTESFILNGNHS